MIQMCKREAIHEIWTGNLVSAENSKMALVTEVDINIEVSDADDPGATPLAPLIDSTALIKCQPNQVIKSVQLFQGKGPKGQIHVWWLFDDGGKRETVRFRCVGNLQPSAGNSSNIFTTLACKHCSSSYVQCITGLVL